MPWAAPKRCTAGHPPFRGRRCPECARASERRRPNARQRGYDADWERASKAFLDLPGNEHCACGCGRIADVVDHKVAHKGDRGLFWDLANWQPMNRRCNSRKAATTEGGFGRTVR